MLYDSTAHWVGYVDDSETPEMIMKKFEELERLQSTKPNAPAPAPASSVPGETSLSEKKESDGESAMDIDAHEPPEAREEVERVQPLDEVQLEELFRRTSSIPAVDGNLEFSLVLGDDADVLIDEDNDYLVGEEVCALSSFSFSTFRNSLQNSEDDEDSGMDISEEDEEDYIDEFRENFFMANQRQTRRRTSPGSVKIRTGEAEYFLNDSDSSSSRHGQRQEDESSTTSVKEQYYVLYFAPISFGIDH